VNLPRKALSLHLLSFHLQHDLREVVFCRGVSTGSNWKGDLQCYRFVMYLEPRQAKSHSPEILKMDHVVRPIGTPRGTTMRCCGEERTTCGRGVRPCECSTKCVADIDLVVESYIRAWRDAQAQILVDTFLKDDRDN
jgi:hypothetical protein